jgi:hypothetical protein
LSDNHDKKLQNQKLSINPPLTKQYVFPKRVGIVFVEKRKEIKITIKNFIAVFFNKIKEKRTDKKLPSLDFDQEACAFFLLAMNSQQSIFEFQIIDSERIKIPRCPLNRDIIVNWLDNFALQDKIFATKARSAVDYWVAITSEILQGNWFFTTERIRRTKSSKRIWIITSKDWKRYYSPPSVFEYFATSIVRIVLESLTRELEDGNLRKLNSLETHIPGDATKGCIFDFTNYKSDRRILISNPNLCSDCRLKLTLLETLINEKLGKGKRIPLMDHLNKIISRTWMGKLDEKDCPFYNLKKVYNYDVDHNSGFNKGFLEKFRDSIYDKSAEWTIGTIITGIGSGIAALILYSIFGKPPAN